MSEKKTLDFVLDRVFPAARDVYRKVLNNRDFKELEEFYQNSEHPGYRLLMKYMRIGRVIHAIRSWEQFYIEQKEEDRNWGHATIKLLDELKTEKDKSGIELFVQGIENLDRCKGKRVLYALPHDYGDLEGIFAWAVIGSYVYNEFGKHFKEIVNDLFGTIENFDKAAFFVMNVVHKLEFNKQVRINLSELRKSINFLEENGHLGTFLTAHNPYFSVPNSGIVDGEAEKSFYQLAKHADLVVPIYVIGPRQHLLNYVKGVRNIARTRYLFSFGGKEFIMYIGEPRKVEDLVGDTYWQIADNMRYLCRTLPDIVSGPLINVKSLLPENKTFINL